MSDNNDVQAMVLTALKWIAIGALIAVGIYFANRWFF